MTNIECLQPNVVTAQQWGPFDKVLSLSSGEVYQCVVIGPESDADQVEIRLSGRKEFGGEGGRFIVGREAPLIMPLKAEGLSIHSMRKGSNAGHLHKLQLLFYRYVPPFLPVARPSKRFEFELADVTGNSQFPFVPTMGRKRMFWSMYVDGSNQNITVVHQGITVANRWNYDSDYLLENFDDYSGANAALVNPVDNDVFTEVLKTEVLSSTGYTSYQYEGRFDFVRTTITYNSGTVDVISEKITVED